MARPKKEVTEEGGKGFDPSALSEEEQEAVVEYYLGVHPKYFNYEGLACRVDVYRMNLDRVNFNGWKKVPLW